jgi:hypothetical protein
MPTIDRAFTSWFMPPTNSYDVPMGFSGSSIYNAFVFGTAERYDLHVSVSPPTAFNDNDQQYAVPSQQEYRAETEDGNRQSTREQSLDDYNNARVIAGNGNYPQRQAERYLIRSPLEYSNPGIVTPVLALAVNAAQFGVGAANSSKIGTSHVSTWNNVLGTSFYTIQTANYVADYSNRTLHYTYTFMSPSDKNFDRYVRRAQRKIR